MDSTSEEILTVSTKLVAKAQLMLRKPSINSDIIGLLDECLKKTEKQAFFLSNGICNINFSEIAIVIELCSLIYGKKVSLLLDNLLNYQKDLAKFNIEKKKVREEEDAIEKRLGKFKRKRKKKPEPIIRKTKGIDFKSVVHELDAKFDYKEVQSLKSRALDPLSHFMKKDTSVPIDRYLRPLFVTSDYTLPFEDEDITNNNQLLTNNIQFEGSDYIRQLEHNVLGNKDIGALGSDLMDEISQKFLVEKNITFIEITNNVYLKELNHFIEKELQERSPLRKICKRLCPRRSSIHLIRLSDDVVNHYLKKDGANVHDSVASTSSLSQDSGIFEAESSQELSTEGQNSKRITEVDNRENVIEADNSENVTASDNSENITNDDCGDNTDSYIENLNENPEIVKNNCQSRCVSDKIITKNEQNEKENSNKTEKNKKITKVDDKTIQTPERTSQREKRKSKKPLDEDFVNLDEEEEKASAKKRKISEDLICRKIITRTLKEFELFFYKNYHPEDGEGVLAEPIFPEEPIEEICETTTINKSQNSGICEDVSFENDDVNDNTPDLSDTMMNVTPSIEINNETNNEVNNKINNEPTPLNKVLNKPKAPYDETHAAMVKYLRWKDCIRGKLAESEKKDFDIHEYETQILDILPDNEEVSLKKVMSGKKPAQVARLFAASLQLTNTSNIELSNVIPGKLANNALKMRVLSRERHHEHLETYEAPSIENRKAVMKRIRAMESDQVATHSRSMLNVHIPHKKHKR